MAEVILLLGSNLEDKEKYLNDAITRLKEVYKILKVSSKYISKPWGYESENDFINIAVLVECNDRPQYLLLVIKGIENELGRVRVGNNKKYMDRTIDIDIILYGDQMINSRNLIIPHPRFHLRNFCLAPMNEIIPNKIIPGFNKSVNSIRSECPDRVKVALLYDKV